MGVGVEMGWILEYSEDSFVEGTEWDDGTMFV